MKEGSVFALPTDDVSDGQAQLIGRGVGRKLHLIPEQQDAGGRDLEFDGQHLHGLTQRSGLEREREWEESAGSGWPLVAV